MTQFEALKEKNLVEFAQWLLELQDSSEFPWDVWFNENYCKKCDSIFKVVSNPFYPSKQMTQECSFCEINNCCRFFPEYEMLPSEKIIELWLVSNERK